MCAPHDLQACGYDGRALMKVLTRPPTLGGIVTAGCAWAIISPTVRL